MEQQLDWLRIDELNGLLAEAFKKNLNSFCGAAADAPFNQTNSRIALFELPLGAAFTFYNSSIPFFKEKNSISPLFSWIYEREKREEMVYSSFTYIHSFFMNFSVVGYGRRRHSISSSLLSLSLILFLFIVYWLKGRVELCLFELDGVKTYNQ